ncbi:hypothetical protein K2X30_06940 [bacterium]|nr:hypothetical protein [bacterium]
MEKKVVLYAIHGFLGRPDDWDFLEEAAGKSCQLIKVDVLKECPPSKYRSLEGWAASFNQRVEKETPKKYHRGIMGYSMGGRMALHALVAPKSPWNSAMILSSNLGLPEDAGDVRADRIQKDSDWARRFLNDPWNEVCAAWNNQAIFGGKPAPKDRQESEFDKKELAAALNYWTLGKQADLLEPFRAKIKTWALGHVPLFWGVGELDEKYVEQARQLTKKIELKSRIFPGAYHRFPWDEKEAFLGFFNDYLLHILFNFQVPGIETS